MRDICGCAHASPNHPDTALHVTKQRQTVKWIVFNKTNSHTWWFHKTFRHVCEIHISASGVFVFGTSFFLEGCKIAKALKIQPVIRQASRDSFSKWNRAKGISKGFVFRCDMHLQPRAASQSKEKNYYRDGSSFNMQRGSPRSVSHVCKLKKC